MIFECKQILGSIFFMIIRKKEKINPLIGLISKKKVHDEGQYLNEMKFSDQSSENEKFIQHNIQDDEIKISQCNHYGMFVALWL